MGEEKNVDINVHAMEHGATVMGDGQNAEMHKKINFKKRGTGMSQQIADENE